MCGRVRDGAGVMSVSSAQWVVPELVCVSSKS